MPFVVPSVGSSARSQFILYKTLKWLYIKSGPSCTSEACESFVKRHHNTKRGEGNHTATICIADISLHPPRVPSLKANLPQS